MHTSLTSQNKQQIPLEDDQAKLNEELTTLLKSIDPKLLDRFKGCQVVTKDKTPRSRQSSGTRSNQNLHRKTTSQPYEVSMMQHDPWRSSEQIYHDLYMKDNRMKPGDYQM